jgi:hypothetical protein
MLGSKFGWSVVLGLAVASVACGKSEDDAGDDDAATAGTGGASAGRAAGGRTGADAGRGGTAGSGGTAAGRGGSAGTATGAGTGGTSAGRGSAGAPEGGAEAAGRSGGGRAGTGGTTGDAGAPEGGTDPGGALEAIHDAVATACSAAATCCAAQGLTPMLDDCEAMYDTYQSGIAGIMAGHVTVDMAAVARCKAAYAAGPDQCNLNAVVAACKGVYVGHQGVGEPCVGGYDCDRSTDTMTCLVTDSSSQPYLGTCQKVPRAELNQTCFSTCRAGEDCSSTTLGIATPEELALCFEDDGLYCEFLESGSVCRSILPVGEECGSASFDACGSKALCDTTCVELSDIGESCGSCIHQYTCIDGTCTDPDWANESTCMGFPPGP